jgi:putative methyltransferase
LLVHDYLLARKGLAAPVSHPLRLAVEKHKARLQAEFTKARLKRGFSTTEAFRTYVNKGQSELDSLSPTLRQNPSLTESKNWLHPRWVRVNTLKTSLEEQLKSTFSGYRLVDSLSVFLEEDCLLDLPKALHVDVHVPDLIALAPTTDISAIAAYKDGSLIVQDKASCFPAYLLDPQPEDGHIVDACAAPGNKTTHLAALIKSRDTSGRRPRIWACERDKVRAVTLHKMVAAAKAGDLVEIRAGQDFLQVDPQKEPWCDVGALLLDPSCSGSGIIGRDIHQRIALASRDTKVVQPTASKKRKRKVPVKPDSEEVFDVPEEVPLQQADNHEALKSRLQALSKFQTKLLLHAFCFPKARKITYSTCSVHAEENEEVVTAALASPIAKTNGWRLLPRAEQVQGMRNWDVRGDFMSCGGDTEVAEACIRCNKGTKEGTQGFFVAAFVRSLEDQRVYEDEWSGIEDN